MHRPYTTVSTLIRYSPLNLEGATHLSAVRQNVFTIILPDYSAIDVWARAMFWHPSAFYACQYSTAVHQDLVAGRVTESVSPVAIACLGKCLELLQQELSAPVLKPEMALMTVGLLANNKPDKETMKAMYDTAPLDFESLLETPTSLQVWSQLQYAEPHADMMHWLIRKLGGLEKLQTPGLALTVA